VLPVTSPFPSPPAASPAGPPATGADDPAPSPSGDEPPVGEALPEEAQPAGESGPGGFHVHLEVFDGPFDLLLGLISKHKLDVTEVALSKVTDDFIAHIRAHGPAWDLDQASQFLVVAATLLDLKAARLLPAAEVEDEDDLELLEARDLLFARLLQYRAYKQVAAVFSARMETESRRHPRAVGMEPRFASLLPEVLLGLGPHELAALAARALTPKAPPTVAVEHVHAPMVSVREQAVVLADWLRRAGGASFRGLTSDCESTLYVVARFLALLELYREGAVSFDQVSPLSELHVRWTGGDAGDVEVGGDFDGPGDVAPAGTGDETPSRESPPGESPPGESPADEAPPEDADPSPDGGGVASAYATVTPLERTSP
jgi:segregation and condensation protein A